jgi:hypothetical protein
MVTVVQKVNKWMVVCILCLPMISWANEKLEQSLEDHFRIYILKEERRNPGDRVVVKTDRQGNQYASLYYWRNLDHRNPADVICDAYRWLLLGRTTFGQGAQEAFKDHDKLARIQLRYFDLEFSSKRGKKKGEIVPTFKAKEYMVLTVNRDSLLSKRIDDELIGKTIEQGKCPTLKGYMDKTWFDQNYMRSRSE